MPVPPSADAASDALDAGLGVFDAVSDAAQDATHAEDATRDAADAVLDATQAALDAADAVPNSFDAAQDVPDVALDAAQDVSDAADGAQGAPDVVLDVSDAVPEAVSDGAQAPPDAADAAVVLPDAAPPPVGACEAPVVHMAPPLARLNDCGVLSYGLYANRDQEQVVHRLPDFSHAGYQGGGVVLPEVPVAVTLDVGEGDAHGRIQDALDAVSRLQPDADGLRGAVLLRSGRWEVSDTLFMRTSGVVLRGEGQGRAGTELVFTRQDGVARSADFDFIVLQGVEGNDGSPLRARGESRRITTEYVPVGARRFSVVSAEGLQVGDVIGVRRTPNQRWIDALRVNRHLNEDAGDVLWTPESYRITHERRVRAIDADRLTVDIPVVDTMEGGLDADDGFGGGEVFPLDVSGRVRQAGVEDLRLVSNPRDASDEQHGWKAVKLRRAQDCWVRRVTVEHFGYAAVSIEDASSFNTVEEVAMLDPHSEITGGRRYAFNVSGGVGNLFQRCYSRNGRHDFVTGSRTTGPNVWLDCYAAQSHNDAGPHHRWSTGLLFDNVAARYLHVENRGTSGSGHGWSGAQVMFWNGEAEGVRCDAPPGAMNWSVGTTGAQQDGQWVGEEPPSPHWESRDGAVEPRSLYLQQLADRLGVAAVAQVTTAAQRDGRIWDQLAAWAGEGRLADAEAGQGDPRCAGGVVSGTVCCEAACGQCGGVGCGARPGGAAACCVGAIRTAGRRCTDHPPPCLLDP